MIAMIETSLATGRADLEQIQELQRENHRDVVSTDDAQREGFITITYTLDTLERMHAVAPSVIARSGTDLAGYALVMSLEARISVPILEPIFRKFETLSWRGEPLAARPYYVMGQICVARPYRGQGVFDALYREHRARYASRFELCVTEIATRNTRSMRAHARVGFGLVKTYRDAVDEWAVVAWDWTLPRTDSAQ